MPEYIPEKEEKFLTEQEVRAIVSSSMENVGMFGGGAGNETFQFDRRKGIWLGAKNFDDAPFKVDMDGLATAVGLNVEWINIGNTDGKKPADNADVTADNGQDYSWIGGSKPPSDADATQAALNLGAAIDYAKANGVTLIQGGYIRTGLVNASYINTGTLVVGRTEAKCTDPNADETEDNTADDVNYIGSHTGWQITSGYIKSNNGYIELKGSDTPHIKAISSSNSNDYVQMTSASDTPRFDVYANYSSSYRLRVRIEKTGVIFYTGTGTQQGRLSGYYVSSTDKGLYADVEGKFYCNDRIVAEDSIYTLLSGNFVAQNYDNTQSIQMFHSGISGVTGNGYISTTAGALMLRASNHHVIPDDTNNDTHLGSATYGWCDVWAGDISINQSDLAEVEQVHPQYILAMTEIKKQIKLKYQKLKDIKISKIKHYDISMEDEESIKGSGKKVKKRNYLQEKIKAIQSDVMNENFEIKRKRVSKIPLGSVVAISDEGCLPTNEKCQTNILGVVSTEPGLKLDSHAEGIFIAKVGKVPCRVIGKCKAGDLLQSSDTEGCAEKSENPKTGSIIGRAKETKNTLKEEKIKIEVQLM